MRRIAALSALSLVACTHGGFQAPETPEGPSEYFVLRTEDGIVESKITTEGLSGADIQITRYGPALRGRAFGRTVDLHWQDDAIRGLIGTAPVDLIVEQDGDQIEMRGLYAGRQGTLTIKPGKLEGTIGGCTYGLQSGQTGSYAGQTTCGGVPVQTSLSLPPILTTMTAVEIGAHLALFLGR